ncbi:site-2 protease family protein [Actinocorallia sp. A-T 12471]|uniref:M50 family metallopeptidase n=1 Tax=Actinocorallia sp. A-T 12471 TaxID=3089813 RepID=UPI0029D0F63F|nr:site-2 protease family protein [Actinocorallia sp. A-T 12471]MDX6743642.1 site-2 protease family protein [Actinocorallia sp. A-T 12471]
MTVVGIVVFFGLLMASIALHELGHLIFAKWFGVRCPQYMVGFGPTVRSWRRGETEYGIKWIPFGGYVRMIGMLPPRAGDPEGALRKSSTGRFAQLVDSARASALEEVGPGDGDRVFYAKPWWQKALISFAGPLMNFLLALVFLGAALMGIGVREPSTTIGTVAACVVPATETGRGCTPADAPTPAAAAGLRPGDEVLAFDGTQVTTYRQFQGLIREAAGRPVTLRVVRDGQTLDLATTPIANQVNDLADPTKTVTAGFIGITPVREFVRQGPGDVLAQFARMTTVTLQAFARLPEKMVGVWNASFHHAKRDIEGPVGIVGASRIGGEVLASHDEAKGKAALFLMVLGSLNFGIAAFNMVPLLPLDGGNIAGALWEGMKRAFAALTGRPAPAPVDVAKALPLTYVVGAVILFMGLLLVYADLVNPIRLGG